MMTKEKEVIEIPLSKQKLTLMLIGSIVFLVVGVLFVLEPEKYLSVVCRNPIMIFASGFASILFSTICAFYLVRKLPDNKPGLIIVSS